VGQHPSRWSGVVHNPSRGEVWNANLDPTSGHEQAGTRPVLIISADKFNHGPAHLVVVVPITSKYKPIPSRVEIVPPQGGCAVVSYAIPEAIRSISRTRLRAFMGNVDSKIMEQVKFALMALLNFD
jgi:mRNA interferase MazF